MELLQNVMKKNFIEYSSYVIKDRAIPDIRDGLKPVQRRILHTLYEMDDGKFHKVANVVGACMRFHPHGDASIYSALVHMANRDYFIEKQGNFGNLYTGDDAAAARYIECRLTPLAKDVLFNDKITHYEKSYDGRNTEPLYFPCKVPYTLMTGSEGIAVGMATKILPHNFVELLNAQIQILKGEEFEIFPDFQQAGFMDVSEYDKGNGRVRIRAHIEKSGTDTLTIKEIPWSTTTESLMSSIEEAAKKGKLKISKLNDYTAEQVEIEIILIRGTDLDATLKALYAFTACEVSVTTSLLVLDEKNPKFTNIEVVLERNTKDLLYILKQELYYEWRLLKRKRREKCLEQLFIENRLYKKIEDCESDSSIHSTLISALNRFKDQFEGELTLEDIEKLLQIRIKKISKFDREQNLQEIQKIEGRIQEVRHHLQEIREYAIDFLKNLLKKYGKLYPRQTKITTFQNIDRSKIALKNIKIRYDSTTGYLGTSVKEGELICECNPYQKIVILTKTGSLKVVSIPEKILCSDPILYAGVQDKKRIWTILYQGKEGYFLKRFSVLKYQLDKEYFIFPQEKRNSLFYWTSRSKGKLEVLIPSESGKGSESHELHLDQTPVKPLNHEGTLVALKIKKVLEHFSSLVEEEELEDSLDTLEEEVAIEGEQEEVVSPEDAF
jgi:topoisomerase-4 subunit A